MHALSGSYPVPYHDSITLPEALDSGHIQSGDSPSLRLSPPLLLCLGIQQLAAHWSHQTVNIDR